ncbi:MAG TPA: flagellar motor protein MotB [Caldilineae bacterium]|nr:flagellar motor protein MotB [Caldilineae bacterium]
MAGGGHDSTGGLRWLLTYADLITLLLAFFIVMYASSKSDLERFHEVVAAIQRGFGVGVNILPAGGGTGILPEQGRGTIPLPELSQRSKDFIAISEILAARTAAQGTGRFVAVNMRREGIAITLSGALLFPSGGTELSPESIEILDEIARFLAPLPNQIRVEAHTDDLPTNDPRYPTNWELSVARAVTVVRYLIEHGNIQPERLIAVGRAEYDPLFPNDSREHRALNRRADIVILYPPEEEEGPSKGLDLPIRTPAAKSRNP